MADLLRLPSREILPLPHKAGGPSAEIIDISQRHIFNVDPHNVAEVLEDIVRLPNHRDREAAVISLVRDYRRVAKKRHGASGRPLDGACRAIGARLRRAIREELERRE